MAARRRRAGLVEAPAGAGPDLVGSCGWDGVSLSGGVFGIALPRDGTTTTSFYAMSDASLNLDLAGSNHASGSDPPSTILVASRLKEWREPS